MTKPIPDEAGGGTFRLIVGEVEEPETIVEVRRPYILIELADDVGMAWEITCGNGAERQGLGWLLATIGELLGTQFPDDANAEATS
jgi:hypothetical protein